MSKRRPWTKRELAVVRRKYPNTDTRELAREIGRSVRSVYLAATKLGLRKSERYLEAKRRAEGQRLRELGRAHRFPRGHVPWNAGLKGYNTGGRSAETRFRPGHRPVKWVPIGTEVVDADGYLKRKVRDDAPPGMSRRNWKYVHVLVWEEANGPVPEGHAIVFKDGDKTNVVLENLECIPRSELMKRNSIHRLPKELAHAIQLIGAINRKVNRHEHRQAERAPVRHPRKAEGSGQPDGDRTSEGDQ